MMPEAAPPPRVHVIDYNRAEMRELDVTDVESLRPYRDGETVTWIDVQGLGDEQVLRRIGEIFSVHELALADIVNTPQRPKVEDYDDHELIISRMAHLIEPPRFEMEQISIVLGRRFVLTFQETYGDVLDPVRMRIRQNGLIRHMGADFLAYAIVDAVIDGYYPVLEVLGEYLEDLEDEVVANPTPATLRKIHEVKRELIQLRRAIWPQRDTVNSLIRDEFPRVSQSVRVYLRDCYDHTVQIMDVVESYREVAASFMEVYLSSVSNRMNEIMKLLTVIATIFIPLTFIVGVYGMNFENMPELHWRWSYAAVWLIMVAIAAVMLIFFRRRGWLSTSVQDDDSS
jgi:magnesium transporter